MRYTWYAHGGMYAAAVRNKLNSLSSVDQTRELINLLGDEPCFRDAANEAQAELLCRDRHDEHALAAGIDYAKRVGVLSSPAGGRVWHTLGVDGLSPAQVAHALDNMKPAVREMNGVAAYQMTGTSAEP